MRLKSIEINGFKSFYNRTKLNFPKEISAIVGPNGSGKSNISDAIKWVLGEQSAKNLRGEKMSDVIFSGSKNLKPLNYASVNMIFSNEDRVLNMDCEEVSITRRVYRTGESEYLVNGESKRLKDLREIFLDTGVGKEGYSIIGQGRIESILSNKAEERRYIFEEACGIAKFKMRKDESERKLEQTKENIEKLEDLLYVKEERVNFLEKQSEKAIKARNILKEIKEKEYLYYFYEISKNEDLKKAIEEKKIALKEDIRIREEENEDIKNRLNPSSEKIRILNQQIQNLSKEFENTQKDIFDLKNELQMNDQALDFYKKDDERIESDKKYIEEKQKNLYEKKKSKEFSYENLEKEFLDVKKSLKEKEESSKEFFYSYKKHQEEYLQKKSCLKELYSKSDDLKLYLNTARELKLSNDRKIKENADIIESFLKESEENNDELLSFKKRLDEITIFLDEESLKKINEENDLENKKIQHDEILKQISKINISGRSLENKLSFYEGLVKNFEGYNRNTQNLLKFLEKEKSLKKGVYGAVAELIDVVDIYQKAINEALGYNLQNIVVDSSKTASNIIEAMKKEKLSKVTFLPVDSVVKKKKVDVSNDKDIIIIASEAVKTSLEIKNIIENLLNTTAIVKDINTGIAVSKRYGYLRIVTLDGDIINPSGSMTGGYKKENEATNLLGRKKLIEDLKRQIKDLKESQKEKESIFEDIKMQINKSFNIIKDIEEKEVNLKKEREDILYKKKSLKTRNEYIKDRLNDLDISYEEDEDELLKYQKDFEKIKIQIEEREKEFAILKKSIQEEDNQKQEEEKEIIILKNKESVLERDLLILKDEIEDIKNEIENAISDFSKKESDIKSIEDKNKSIFIRNKEIEKTIEIKSEKITKLKEDISQKEQDINIINEDNLKLNEKSFNLLKEINEIDKSLNKTLFELESICEKIENSKSYIKSEYSLSDDDLSKYIKNATNSNIKKKEIESLKINLRSLGYISFESIIEYEEAKKEYDFLNNQISDLNKSKKDLEKIIKDLKVDMEITFKENMKKINKNFQEIFKILFEGGSASLELDGEDVLDCGIEIMAQPPGKRVHSLSLLSGGERSLTAVAILFAIFETRPAPFCLLDEIDAALDEANIDRYKAYLEKLKKDTQFILITHRKTTMEIADTLYGVSMQKDGVSQVLTLNLEG